MKNSASVVAALSAEPVKIEDAAHLGNASGGEIKAVEVHIGMLAFDRPVAPRLYSSVNLLVQVRYRRRRHARAPHASVMFQHVETVKQERAA
jgi:hypothetical protein